MQTGILITYFCTRIVEAFSVAFCTRLSLMGISEDNERAHHESPMHKYQWKARIPSLRFAPSIVFFNALNILFIGQTMYVCTKWIISGSSSSICKVSTRQFECSSTSGSQRALRGFESFSHWLSLWLDTSHEQWARAGEGIKGRNTKLQIQWGSRNWSNAVSHLSLFHNITDESHYSSYSRVTVLLGCATMPRLLNRQAGPEVPNLPNQVVNNSLEKLKDTLIYPSKKGSCRNQYWAQSLKWLWAICANASFSVTCCVASSSPRTTCHSILTGREMPKTVREYPENNAHMCSILNPICQGFLWRTVPPTQLKQWSHSGIFNVYSCFVCCPVGCPVGCPLLVSHNTVTEVLLIGRKLSHIRKIRSGAGATWEDNHWTGLPGNSGDAGLSQVALSQCKLPGSPE
ncbi:hypothetical protein PM082_013568 [Marasmius tenuissimus]|nr:hypothetical protein PM082_013568 [Marasmius tenuissimus]